MPKPKPQPKTRRTDEPPPYGITLDDFRGNPENVGAARSYWQSPFGQRAMGVLIGCRPRGALRGDAVTSETALHEVGRMAGFEDALTMIHAMLRDQQRSDPVEVDWQADEPQTQE